MTHTTKWIVGVAVVIALLIVVGVLVVAGFVYYVSRGNSKGDYDAKRVEGREFGKTTDQAGCMKEGLERSKGIKRLDINGFVNNQVFVEECLKSARPTPGFCNGVPPLWKLQDDDWATEQCEKVGMNELRTGCASVFQAKLTVCRFK